MAGRLTTRFLRYPTRLTAAVALVLAPTAAAAHAAEVTGSAHTEAKTVRIETADVFHECLTPHPSGLISLETCGRGSQSFTLHDVEDGTFEIKTSGGKCLTADEAPDTGVGLGPCGERDGQNFRFDPSFLAPGMQYTIKTTSDRCLTADRTQDLSYVKQASCSPHGARQKFNLPEQDI